jgi:hypothetical protein
VFPQLLPRDLVRPGDERHRELILAEAEQDAAYDLPGLLPALARSLLQGGYFSAVLEDLVGDTKGLERDAGWRFFVHVESTNDTNKE